MPDLAELKSDWPRRRHYLPMLAVAGLGILISVAAWFAVSAWEQRLSHESFSNVAGDYAAVLQNGLDQHLGKIRAVAALYESSSDVRKDEFDLFTSRILRGDATKMWLIWLPRVKQADRDAFIAAARKSVLPDYTIRAWAPNGEPMPAEGVRSEYFPILYSTGDAKWVLGMDLFSEPGRRRAIETARDTDSMAVAQGLTLRTTEGTDDMGFFAAVPIYREGMPRSTVQERRDSFLGIVGGVFKTETVMNKILSNALLPQNVDLYLFPKNAGPDAAPVFARGGDGRQALTGGSKATIAKTAHRIGVVRAGNARWDLYVAPETSRLSSFYRAWLVALALFTAFAAVLAYMWASIRHALRLETANSKIMELAQTDLLTNLANRRAFLKGLGTAFSASWRGAPPFAVLYLDIDDFKDVNDTLGHAMGDLLLQQVVERLRQALKPDDLIARFGGDEFAILMPDVSDATTAGALADRLGKILSVPFHINDHEVRVTSSIGISIYAPEIAGPEAMMMQADLALYGAKGDGRNCYRFHSKDLDQQVHERVRIADELRGALENNELELYYQPQVELATGRIVGLEGLIRWNHQKRGLLAPGYFIPIAERTGAIIPLGHWVFEEACRQLKLWHAEGIAPQVLAVNVSGVQFKGATELEREVEASLTRWGIEPSDIELELTESVLMEASQKHSGTLDRLRQLGTRIAIDDFGTGYSSLKYLTVYPVNRLKLAQEFVYRVTVDYRNAAVVRAAIRLARELGLDVIAEGVETEAQMRFLLASGCEHAQGYYFSRPVPAKRATELLRIGRVEPVARSASLRSSSAA